MPIGWPVFCSVTRTRPRTPSRTPSSSPGESFDDLRAADPFGAWFDRILVNGCRDRLRRRNVVRFIPMEADIDPAGRDPFQAFIERDALLAGSSGSPPTSES